MRQMRGFTLIELMIVVAIIAIIAAIAIPGLLRSRIGTNETSAIGSLRSMSTAEEQFKQQAVVDMDGDGMGEYGFLCELAGNADVRGPQGQMNTSPFIAAILGVRDGNGFAQKSGYYFQSWLPAASGTAITVTVSTSTIAAGNSADSNDQEVRWCCYAWPNALGQSGNRAFFVNNAGDVYATANTIAAQMYSGTTPTPAAAAAYDNAIPANAANLAAGVGLVAAGLTATDGGTWVPAGN